MKKTKKRLHISRRFRRFVQANEAVSALEYAIMVGVVAVAIVAAMGTFTDSIKGALTTMAANITDSTDKIGKE